MDVETDELGYAESSEVDSMLSTDQTAGEHIVSLQLPNGEVCPVLMGSGMVSQPVGIAGIMGSSELDLKLAPDTLEHLRPGRAVIYRFEERGEIWLLQSPSADSTVLQVQALDTGQFQYQQHHVQHIDLASTPMTAIQAIEVGGTMSMEMAGEELVGSEVTEVGEVAAEVGNSSGDETSALMTDDDGHLDSHHTLSHHHLAQSVLSGPRPSPLVHGIASAIGTSPIGAMVHDQGAVLVQDPVPTMLESTDSGPILVGAEETTTVGCSPKVVQGGGGAAAAAVTVNSVVMSVLQKKLSQADQTPLATSGGRAIRRQGGPVHQCSECGTSFSSIFHLRRHQQTHTGARPFACPICSLCFRHKTSLTVHIRRHTGEMPFHCPVCDKRFRDPANFKVHVRSHSDQKNYECKLCSKRFNSASTLYAHNKTHENVKPYTCTECKKSFRFNTTLVRHIRTHTGEKPYACDRCSLCFATASNLAAHRRRHENAERAERRGSAEKLNAGPTHKCDECGQSFHTKPGLKVHIRQQHQLLLSASAVASSSENDPLTVTATAASPSMTTTPVADSAPEWEEPTPATLEGIVVQCSICAEVYFNEKQLAEHMVASHTSTRCSRRGWKGVDTNWEPPIKPKPRTLGPNTFITSRVRQEQQQQARQEMSRQAEATGFLQGAEGSGIVGGAESFCCDTCGKKFDNADVHKAHMRTHNISKGIRVVYTVRSVS